MHPPSGCQECWLQRAHSCVPFQQWPAFPKVRVNPSFSVTDWPVTQHVSGKHSGEHAQFLQTMLWITVISMFKSLGLWSNLIICSKLVPGSFSCVVCPSRYLAPFTFCLIFCIFQLFWGGVNNYIHMYNMFSFCLCVMYFDQIHPSYWSPPPPVEACFPSNLSSSCLCVCVV